MAITAVVMTSCGGGGDDDSSATTAASSVPVSADDPSASTGPVITSPAPVPTDAPAATTPSATTPATTPDDSTAVLAPSNGCPAGTWLVTTEALQGFFDVVGAATGVEFIFSGEVLFTLTEGGGFTYAMTDYHVTQNIGGSTTEVSLVGDISGTYTADDATFVTSNVANDVAATATVNGSEIDATPILSALLAEFPVNNATFVCDGDDLVVNFVTVETTAEVRMIPA